MTIYETMYNDELARDSDQFFFAGTAVVVDTLASCQRAHSADVEEAGTLTESASINGPLRQALSSEICAHRSLHFRPPTAATAGGTLVDHLFTTVLRMPVQTTALATL